MHSVYLTAVFQAQVMKEFIRYFALQIKSPVLSIGFHAVWLSIPNPFSGSRVPAARTVLSRNYTVELLNPI